jgi:hypothetical protein
MQLRDYQNTHIYTPIVERIKYNLDNTHNRQFDVLGLSTSAGKTFTITNFCTEFCFSIGCDVIITSPNSASLEEIKNTIIQSSSQPYIIVANGFAGETAFVAPQPDKQVVLLCHPTYLSQNIEDIDAWSKTRKVVIFSDEAHQGFMCSGPEDTAIAYGYSINDYTAAWHQCLYGISHVAWFLFSATPLKTTDCDDTFNVISEYFDRDSLCELQAAVKNITLYGNAPPSLFFSNLFDGGEFDNHRSATEFVNFETRPLIDCLDDLNSKWNENLTWLDEFYKKHPDFPAAKPAQAIQAKNTMQAQRIYSQLGSGSAIAVDRAKFVWGANFDFYLRKFDCNITSQKIFDYVGQYDNNTTKLIANKSIGNAVNIANLNCLLSFHDRPSVKDWDITTGVEQVLGRMVRFPKVKGIKDWKDAVDFVETKIKDNKISREDAYKWLDIVFKYEVHMVSSDNNLNGIAKYYAKQSYNPQEWESYIQGLIVDWQKSSKKRRSYSCEKTPYAQKGSQSYREYKNLVPECEYCPKIQVNGVWVPSCKRQVAEGLFEEKVYIESLDVHHKHGREDIASMNDYDNLMTVCKMAHNVLDAELNKTKG